MSIQLAFAAVLLAVSATAMTIALSPSHNLQLVAWEVANLTGLPVIEIGPTRADLQVAKDRLVAKTPEPEKAKFRDVRINGYYLCGEVNTKNEMGGYTGYRKFYISLIGTYHEGVIVDPGYNFGYNFDAFYDNACGVAK